MRTKVAYALVSDDKDIYLEQALLSVMSLKHFTPDAHAVLVVDDKTEETLTGNRAGVLEYIDEKIVVTPPSDYSNVEKSRFIKTTLHRYIKGPYLFLDTDTIIAEDISEIDSLIGKGCGIAAVKDSHCDFKEMLVYDTIIAWAKIVGWGAVLKSQKVHFNSGVMFADDSETMHNFYEEWHKNWLYAREKGVPYDQLPLAYTRHVLSFPIDEIEGFWNCQLATDGLRYLYEAKIIHYHGLYEGCNYIFQDKDTYKIIKEKGNVSEKLKEQLLNPRGAFKGHYCVCNADDFAKRNTQLYILAFSKPKVFKFLNTIADVLLHIYCMIIIRIKQKK